MVVAQVVTRQKASHLVLVVAVEHPDVGETGLSIEQARMFPRASEESKSGFMAMEQTFEGSVGSGTEGVEVDGSREIPKRWAGSMSNAKRSSCPD